MNDIRADRDIRAADKTRGVTSGALCLQAGLSRGALRLYEREGLIAAPPRTTGGYRLYPADSVDRLAVIRVVKALGFSLSEIRDLIDLLEGEGLGDKDLRALAAKRIAMIDEKMAGLADLRACLVDCMENPDGPGDEECAAIMRLFRDRPPRRMEEKAPTRRRRAAR